MPTMNGIGFTHSANALADLAAIFAISSTPPAERLHDNEIKLLIVENHPVYAKGLVDILPARFTPILAANAVLMRAALQSQQIDLVVLDLDLGDGSNGLQLLSELLADKLKVVVCTGTASYGQRCMCARLGAQAVLSKDEDGEVILRTLLQVHAGENVYAQQAPLSTGNPDDEIPPLTKREISVLHRIMETPNITNIELVALEDVCEGRIKGVVSDLLDKFKIKACRDKLPAEAKRRGYYAGIELIPCERKPRGPAKTKRERKKRKRKVRDEDQISAMDEFSEMDEFRNMDELSDMDEFSDMDDPSDIDDFRNLDDLSDI